jgi:hypothetical protein
MTAILIDADPHHSLGGSCMRDIINISQYIKKYYKKIIILSNKTFNNKTLKKYKITKITNLEKQIKKFLNNCSKLFIFITGHGYQKKGEEIDGYDEYILTGNKMIDDNKLRKLFIDSNKIPEILIAIDTCHSGTMFDLKNNWKGSEKPRIISISSCLDNQLSSCDIGNIIGYGGILTIQIIETNLLQFLIERNWQKIDKAFIEIKRNMRLLKQTPLIQYEL